MKASTNMPSGRNAILDVNRPKQKMNVSAEADAAFMADLKRNDPARYKKLIENMQKAYFEMQGGEEISDIDLNWGRGYRRVQKSSYEEVANAPQSGDPEPAEDVAAFKACFLSEDSPYTEYIQTLPFRKPDRQKENVKGPTTPAEESVQIRFCDNQKDGKHRLPDDARTNAKYCDLACKQAAYRNKVAQSVRPPIYP